MTAKTDAAVDDADSVSPQPTEMAPEERHSAADHMVRNYALGAMAVTLVPVPLVDLAGLVAVRDYFEQQIEAGRQVATELRPKPRRGGRKAGTASAESKDNKDNKAAEHEPEADPWGVA